MSAVAPPPPSRPQACKTSPMVQWLLESMPCAATAQDLQFRLIGINDQFTLLTGYFAEDLLGRDASRVHHPDDLALMRESRARLMSMSGEPVVWRMRMRAADDRTLNVELRSRLVETGTEKFVLHLITSVVERPADPLVMDSSELFRVLFDESPMPTSIQNLETFRFTRVNRAYVEMCGYSAAELAEMDPLDLHFPEDHAEMLSAREEFFSKQRLPDEKALGGELFARRMRHKSGRVIHYRIAFRELRLSGGQHSVVAVLVNTDVEVAAREVIEIQNRQIRRHFELAPVALVVCDDQFRVAAVNSAFTVLTGYRSSEVIGKPSSLWHEDSPTVHQALERKWAIVTPEVGRVARLRVKLRRRDGRNVWTEFISTRIDDTDGKVTFLSVVSDVAAEHQLSDELRRQVLYQAALLRSMSAGVAHVVDGTVRRVNASMELLVGESAAAIEGRPIDQVVGGAATWRQLVPLADRSVLSAAAHQVLTLPRPGAEPLVCDARLRWIDVQQADLGMILTLTDITELKAGEAALQRRNAELEALLENGAVAIAYLEDGVVVRSNRLLESILGAEPDSLIGARLADHVRSDDAGLSEVLQAGVPLARSVTTRGELLARDAPVPCVVHIQPVDPKNAPAATVFVAIDFSGQQAVELQLAEVRERFERFAEVMDELAMVFDSRLSRALYCNGRLPLMFGVQTEAFMREPVAAFTHIDGLDRARVLDACARARGLPQQELEVLVHHPERGDRVVRVRVCASRSGIDEVYCTAEDITDYRRLERERLDEALKQRDMLVREVHHRIKNNLQGVAGLLQQIAQRRPELGTALDEIAGQIQAIAQVHGLQVRDSNELAPLRIIEAMLQNLARNFGLPIALETTEVELLEGWMIPEQEAVPLALVINELGTNAIKHRLAGGAVGARLGANAEGLTLSIWNDGKLPAGFDFGRLTASPSGLGLVKAMLPRRGTRLTFSEQDGQVRVSLSMSVPAVRAQARRDSYKGG